MTSDRRAEAKKNDLKVSKKYEYKAKNKANDEKKEASKIYSKRIIP